MRAKLAGELADLLPSDQSGGYRDRLADLAVTVIAIKPLPNRMQYDRKEIFVEAGRPVEIVFENIDIMPHNLLITSPGSLVEVGMAAERMATRPDAFELQFVPKTRNVLYTTKLPPTPAAGEASIHGPLENWEITPTSAPSQVTGEPWSGPCTSSTILRRSPQTCCPRPSPPRSTPGSS